MSEEQEAACCVQCNHPLGPHVMFALGEHVRDGGVMVCNQPDCDCVNTWALDGMHRPVLPDAEMLYRLREWAQTEPGRHREPA